MTDNIPMESVVIEKLLGTAVECARSAGRILMEMMDSRREVRYKGEADLVTDADTTSEEFIVGRIEREYPRHSILAEEGSRRDNDPEFVWIIDPLDGTTNYAHNFPVFCVSIALRHQDDLLLGVIYNPILDELFTAVAGRGLYLNGKKASISDERILKNSLLATGFPYDKSESDRDNIGYFSAFTKNIRGIRRAGSAALDLAYVACGRLDGFWELKLKPWDIAAGALMVVEAGGRITGLDGEELDIFVGDVVASNGFIHEAMLEKIKTVDRAYKTGNP